MCKIFFFFLSVVLAPACFAQLNPLPENQELEQFLEKMAEQNQQEDHEATSLLNDLAFFSEHPINLNATTREDLQALHILSDIQICNLFAHIENNGKLMTIYEIQVIEGFDPGTIQKLLPYVQVRSTGDFTSLTANHLLKGEHTFLLRYAQVLETQTGFRKTDSLSLFKSPNSRYLGSPQKIYVNYRYTYKRKINIGFTAEKDAGELFFKHRLKVTYPWYTQPINKKMKNGFDFYSAYLFFRDLKNIKALAIGDYVLSFGQGLTLWNGLSLGKSADMLLAKKNAYGIRPATSSDENRFMRGLATSLQIQKTCFSFFYSRKAIDASVSDTLENGKPAAISSLQQTGLHSTPSEMKGKQVVIQTTYGAHISYSRKRAMLGMILLNQQLSLPFRNETATYREAASPMRTLHLGLDYQFIFRNVHFFGEGSYLTNQGLAFLNGLLICLDPRLSFTALHRYYASNYENRLGAGFSESSTSAEKGLYLGITTNISKAVQVNACIDRFEFPLPVYQADAPSQGRDLNLQCTYTPFKKFTAAIRIRQSQQEKNTQQQVPVKNLTHLNTSGYRLNLAYQLTPAFQLKNRVEWTLYQIESTHQQGYLIYQDVLFHKPGKPFSLTMRYVLFETDGYDSRLYAYEHDLPGSYSITAYYDRGMRFYLLLNYSFTKYVELWVRYSRTTYDNKEVISEGSLSEILGNTKSELKIQLRVKV